MEIPTTYREAMRQLKAERMTRKSEVFREAFDCLEKLKAEKARHDDCRKVLAEIAHWISEGHLDEQAAEMLKKAEDVLL